MQTVGRALPSKGSMTIVERVTIPGRCRLVDHRHDSPHLLVVLSGEVIEDGVGYRCGDVRVSSPEDRHFLTFTAPTRCLVIEGAVPSPTLGTRRIVRLPSLAEQLGRDPSDERVTRLANSRLLADILARALPPWLAELEDVRLKGRLVGARGIGAVARLAGVSREHLARTYRRHFGTSITEAIKARRLRDAWDAVTLTADPLAQIADGCGFADQSHMTRHFTRWVGLTPAAARRAARQVTRLQDGGFALGL